MLKSGLEFLCTRISSASASQAAGTMSVPFQTGLHSSDFYYCRGGGVYVSHPSV